MVRRLVVCANGKAQRLGAPREALFGSLSEFANAYEHCHEVMWNAKNGEGRMRQRVSQKMWQEGRDLEKRAGQKIRRRRVLGVVVEPACEAALARQSGNG